MKPRVGLVMTLLAAFAFAAPALARGGRGRRPKRKEPKVGQAAPDFELVKLGEDGKKGEKAEKDSKVKLSEQWAKKPLVLVFSSYT